MGGGSEKRGSPRRRTLKAGIIVFSDRHVTLPCSVHDLSATGARLRVTSSVSVPDTFVLIIEIDGFEADCKVVRRKADELGVTFVTVRTVRAKRAQVITPLTPQRPPS